MAILNVGSNQPFASIADAVAASTAGATIQVQAGTYTNDFATINHALTLEAVGGMANMVATEAPPNGKAIMDVNANVTVTGFAFSGAQVADGNGAGIRYEGGNLTLDGDYFHDNQDGLLAGADPSGSITINASEFAHNGAGDGYTHNLYVGDIGALTITDSYFHDAVVGHEIKSRAETTTISNSRVQDGPDGTASYSIDLPNGGNAVIQGNVIEQGPNSQNPAIIAYGEEGNVHAGSSLAVTGNTILNDLTSGSATATWNASGAPAAMTGNAIFGLSRGQLTRGSVDVSGNTTLTSEPALDTSSPMHSTPTPTPAPTPDPAPNPAPVAADTLVLQLSEDMFQGNAEFIASVDGKGLGAAQPVTALQNAGQSEDFTFKGDFGPGVHDLAVTFLNDAYGGTPTTDRNLYVNGVDLDGAHYASATASLYSAGTMHFQIGVPST
ncbi:MAG: hypothetical protein M3Z66_07975 [Chloroflexota bacterium]|nr:hypothetical protein [Chloroflexota bacterium]